MKKLLLAMLFCGCGGSVEYIVPETAINGCPSYQTIWYVNGKQLDKDFQSGNVQAPSKWNCSYSAMGAIVGYNTRFVSCSGYGQKIDYLLKCKQEQLDYNNMYLAINGEYLSVSCKTVLFGE
jgi:hypothetical protein